MKVRYFGTDGIRGPFGGPFITPGFFRRLGFAIGRFMNRQGAGPGPKIVVGRDTRSSGPVLEKELLAGLRHSSPRIIKLGVLPTPAIARLTLEEKAGLGIAITASHNPASDNGIKFFSSRGVKIDDESEAMIEEMLDRPAEDSPNYAEGGDSLCDGIRHYVKFMQTLLPPQSLRGWEIVADAAHGAAWQSTPAVLAGLGARVDSLGVEPDGGNINADFGSEHPQRMAETVARTPARLGIAHDGDGDRLVLCDETGSVLNGDEILAILGLHALHKGCLKKRTLVATVMSNLGLDHALEKAGGRVERVSVGDRHVIAAMLAHGYNVGGESSGHYILSDFGPIGDGLLAALKVIEVMRETDLPLSRLRKKIDFFPQLRCDLRVEEKIPLQELPDFGRKIRETESALSGRGRILVRYSGTEEKIRLLVEGEDPKQVKTAMEGLKKAVAFHLPLK